MNQEEQQQAIMMQINYQKASVIQRFHRAMNRLLLLSRILKDTGFDPDDFSFEMLD